MSDATKVDADMHERSGKLIQLLEQQRGCYRQLKDLAERQRRLITEENPEALLKILAERQKLVDQLTQLNTALAPFRQEWANTYTQMQSDRRQHVQEVLDEINMLLGAIMVTDAEDSRLLAAGKERIGSQMREAAAGRRANTAYAAQAYQTSGPMGTNQEA